MPVVGIPVRALLSRLGQSIEIDELVEHLQHLGCDVEGVTRYDQFRCKKCDAILEATGSHPPVECENCGADFRSKLEDREELEAADVLRMDLLPVRPDLFDPAGMARGLRGYLGQQVGLCEYKLANPTLRVRVDERLSHPESYRPHIACAAVRNIQFDNETIKIVMRLQEDLHWAMGRDRKLASIGVYDLDSISGVEFSYRAVEPDEPTFEPLGMPGVPMTPRQILTDHPKGRQFAHLLADFERYPLLCDSAERVLSMPPIINSEATRVGLSSKNLFIDVTGPGQRIVGRTLNIFVTALMELAPKIVVEQVIVENQEAEIRTPDLTPQQVNLDAQEVARLAGIEVSPEQLCELLARMGHGAESMENGKLRVLAPAYRNDILHPCDLIEDAAIAYGYHNIEPRMIATMTVGSERPAERAAQVVRDALTGLGCFEVVTLPLTSQERTYTAMRLPRRDDCVLIENPVSIEQTIVRVSLLPGLMQTLSLNTDHDLPQYIFEVGDVSVLDDKAPTGARETRRAALAAIGPHVGFATVRAMAEALLRELDASLRTVPHDCPTYLPGRCARILAGEGEEEVGVIGEIHPEVLENHKLVHPAAALELSLESIILRLFSN
jgi:phenylalanyl-tRNA synthetase beta chain